jgi:hypothetical protein
VAIQQTKTDPQKKKTNANLKGLVPQAHVTPGFVIFAATWDAAIERLADQIYNGEVKPTDLDKDLVLKNYAAFNKEAQKAWGKGYYDESLTRDFRENFLKFSGAKSHALMNEIAAIDQKAGMSKDAFTKLAKDIVTKHNDTWLNTELKFCGDVVSSAQEYAGFLADVDIYQNLKYRTMGDSEVRDSHAANEGIVKPVNEWKQLPPFDYGCRCWLEQTLEAPTTEQKLKGIKFSNNPHQSGEVFNEQQSYFQNLEAKNKGIVRDNAERMKSFMPYNRTIKVGDQKVFVNDFYDLIDGEASINAAKLIAKELEKDIYILPHIYNSDKTSIKNPEIGIGKPGTLADLKSWDVKKTTSTENFVKNNVYQANKQGCEWVILDLTKAIEKNPVAVAGRKLHGDLSDASKMNTGIKQVVIIRGKKAIKVSRKQINSKNFMQYFKMD